MTTQPEHERLLGRLLGPAGPELTCEECFEHLDRFVELELAGAEAEAQIPGMRAHLQGCPACDEDHDSLLAFAGARHGRASGSTDPLTATGMRRPGQSRSPR